MSQIQVMVLGNAKMLSLAYIESDLLFESLYFATLNKLILQSYPENEKKML